MTLILGIESSCDETAAAILEDGKKILSNVVASQVDVHKKYGGVVPELASRHHLENIVPVVRGAFAEARVSPYQLEGIAVTQGPGLVGSLLVGINYAKALSFGLGIPLIAVNHIEGHIFSAPLTLWGEESQKKEAITDWNTLLPCLSLVVSGGHTSLFWIKSWGANSQGKECYELLGRTRDDAAGEAFDKVAKLLGFGYPGGALIERLAKQGDPNSVGLPIPRISGSQFDFSFSGIKTAVLRYTQAFLQNELSVKYFQNVNNLADEKIPQSICNLAASFQSTVIRILNEKLLVASEIYQPRSIMLSGGVACNRALCSEITKSFLKKKLPVYFPTPILSTDNAAMIAAAAYPKFLRNNFSDLSLNANVRLKLNNCC